jgi:hypothetical protein
MRLQLPDARPGRVDWNADETALVVVDMQNGFLMPGGYFDNWATTWRMHAAPSPACAAPWTQRAPRACSSPTSRAVLMPATW